MKTIYCPACGTLCTASREGDTDVDFTFLCPKGHGWAATVNLEDKYSSDGTSILIQCNGTPATELPEQ